MVYNNLGISGEQRIFNMVYITDYAEKDIQCQRNFAIILIQADLLSQNLQKWIQTEKRNLKPKFTTLKLLVAAPNLLGGKVLLLLIL